MFCGTIALREEWEGYGRAIRKSVLSSRLYRDVGKYQRGSNHENCDHSKLYGDGIDLLTNSRGLIVASKIERAVGCCQTISDGHTLSRKDLNFLRDIFRILADYYLARTDVSRLPKEFS